MNLATVFTIKLTTILVLAFKLVSSGIVDKQHLIQAAEKLCSNSGRDAIEPILLEYDFADRVGEIASQRPFECEPVSPVAENVERNAEDMPIKLILDKKYAGEGIMIFYSLPVHKEASLEVLNKTIADVKNMKELQDLLKSPTTFAIKIRHDNETLSTMAPSAKISAPNVTAEGVRPDVEAPIRSRFIIVIIRAVNKGPYFKDTKLQSLDVSDHKEMQDFASIHGTKETHLRSPRTELFHEVRNSYDGGEGNGTFIFPMRPKLDFDFGSEGTIEKSVFDYLESLKNQNCLGTVVTAVIQAGPFTNNLVGSSATENQVYLVLVYTWVDAGLTFPQSDALFAVLRKIHQNFDLAQEADLALELATLRPAFPIKFGSESKHIVESVVGVTTHVMELSVSFHQFNMAELGPILFGAKTDDEIGELIKKIEGVGFGLVNGEKSCILIITFLDGSNMTQCLFRQSFNIAATVILGLGHGQILPGIITDPFGKVKTYNDITEETFNSLDLSSGNGKSMAVRKSDGVYTVIVCDKGDAVNYLNRSILVNPNQHGGILVPSLVAPSRQDVYKKFERQLSEIGNAIDEMRAYIPFWLAYQRQDHHGLQKPENDTKLQQTAEEYAKGTIEGYRRSRFFREFTWICNSTDTLNKCLEFRLYRDDNQDMLNKPVQKIGSFWVNTLRPIVWGKKSLTPTDESGVAFSKNDDKLKPGGNEFTKFRITVLYGIVNSRK